MNASSPVADIKLIARQRVPIEVGALQLRSDGGLSEGDPTAPLRFAFRYQNALFTAEMAQESGSLLHLSAHLGRLPYTAESPFARRCVSRILTAGKPPRGRLWIDQHGIVRIDLQSKHSGPRTPVSVLQATVSLLLEARPRLLLLDGLLRPLPGEAKGPALIPAAAE